MTSETKLIVITGMDGAGKSTAIKNISTELTKLSINNHVCSIWDNLQKTPLKTKADMQDYLKVLKPKSRLLFLSHAMLDAIESQLDEPSDILLIDSFIYKYLVNEMARDLDPDFVKHCLDLFPKPDKVFYLKLPIEKAYNRKQELSAYESNGDFVNFQTKMTTYWEQLKNDQSHWIDIDASSTPDTVCSNIIELIKNDLKADS